MYAINNANVINISDLISVILSKKLLPIIPQKLIINNLPIKIAIINFSFFIPAIPDNIFTRNDGVNGNVTIKVKVESLIF